MHLKIFIRRAHSPIPSLDKSPQLIKRINKWFSENLSRLKDIGDIHRSTLNRERLKSRVTSPEHCDNARKPDNNAPSLQLTKQEMLERELDSKITVVMEEELSEMMNYIDHNAPSLQFMLQKMLERELDRKIKVIMKEKLADMINYIDHSIKRKICKLSKSMTMK